MGTVVWKFALQVQAEQQIHMPRGARLLSVHLQHGDPCIWAEVNPANPAVPVTIHMRGTGHRTDNMPSRAQFLGTVLMLGDSLVWHVWWVPHD